jgi:hypothetical protein
VKHIRLSSKLAHIITVHGDPIGNVVVLAQHLVLMYIVPAQCVKESDVGFEKWGTWCSWFHCHTYTVVVNIQFTYKAASFILLSYGLTHWYVPSG